MHRCPNCRATGITVPRAGLDTWVCIRCGHKNETPVSTIVARRMPQLLSELREVPWSATSRAIDAIAANADYHLWDFFGEQMQWTSKSNEAKADHSVAQLAVALLLALVGIWVFVTGAVTPFLSRPEVASLYGTAVVLMGCGVSLVVRLGVGGLALLFPPPYFPKTAALIYPILRSAHAPAAVTAIAPALLEPKLPPDWRKELRERLTELLPRLTNDDIADLGPLTLPALTKLLPRPGSEVTDERWALTIAITDVLGRAGHEPALPVLSAIFELEGWFETPPQEAREAALRACSRIRLEMENRVASRVLLRAPGPGMTDPTRLLRAASDGEPLEHTLIAAAPPDDLLIPCDPPADG